MEIKNEDKNIDAKPTSNIDKFLIVALIVFGAFIFFVNFAPSPKQEKVFEHLEIKNSKNNIVKFNVELADTQKEQLKGLTFRENVPVNEGMLYVFDKIQVVDMNTKNNRVSTDFLFIDDKGIIQKVVKNNKPDSPEIISSVSKVAAVLEVNASTVDKNDIQINDVVMHPFFKNMKDSNADEKNK